MISLMTNFLLLTTAIHLCYIGYPFLGQPIKSSWQWIKHHPKAFLIDVTLRAPTFYFLLGGVTFILPAWTTWVCMVGFVSSLILLFTSPPRNYGEHSIDDEILSPNE